MLLLSNGSGDISLAIEDEEILEPIYVKYNSDSNLRLTYPSDDEGNLANSNIAATPHDFQIKLWARI